MPIKILVLDNTEGISEILNISLTTDYDILKASTGEEALSILDKHSPPLLICDANVPDMDGIEFLCKVKKQRPVTEVIMITDAKNSEIGVKSLKYEASDFIVKPVTSSSLEIVLERAREKLVIKKKLSPSTYTGIPLNQIELERISISKQFINILSESTASAKESDLSGISGIISIHNSDGIIIETSKEHKSLFGNLSGKSSWEIYGGEASSANTCPVTIALKTGNSQRKDVVIVTKNGDEKKAEVFTAPLINLNDQNDLVLEIINLKMEI